MAWEVGCYRKVQDNREGWTQGYLHGVLPRCKIPQGTLLLVGEQEKTEDGDW